jgi:hypothetical protein
VSQTFLFVLFEGNAKTNAQHANTATPTPTNNHILLLFHPVVDIFFGDALELSAY